MNLEHASANWVPEALPPSKPMRLRTALLGGLALTSGLLLGGAVVSLIGSDSAADIVKSALIAIGGTMVAFGTNHLAVTKGAPQAAIGMITSGIVSVTSMTCVALGLFAATYAGTVKSDVEDLRLQDHGQALTQHVDERIRAAASSARMVPAMRAVTDDLADKETCERRSSCVSGIGSGGFGPAARFIATLRQRADSIIDQVEAGDGERERAREQLGTLLEDFRDQLGDPELSNTERRKALQGIDSEIHQALTVRCGMVISFGA